MEADRILSEAFLANHPTDAAGVIERRPAADVAAFLSEGVPDRLAPVLAALDASFAAAVLSRVDPDAAGRLVEALLPDAASRLLRRQAPEVRDAILERLSPRARDRIQALLRYPAGSAGTLLDPTALSATSDLTVEAALERLRQVGRHLPYYLFVVDRRSVLIGVIGVGDLLAAAPDARLSALARRTVAALPATAGRAAIIAHPAARELHALPVVDTEGRLLGAVRQETLRHLEAEEAGAPLETVVGAAAVEVGELAWTVAAAVLDDFTAALDGPSPLPGAGQVDG